MHNFGIVYFRMLFGQPAYGYSLQITEIHSSLIWTCGECFYPNLLAPRHTACTRTSEQELTQTNNDVLSNGALTFLTSRQRQLSNCLIPMSRERAREGLAAAVLMNAAIILHYSLKCLWRCRDGSGIVGMYKYNFCLW